LKLWTLTQNEEAQLLKSTASAAYTIWPN